MKYLYVYNFKQALYFIEEGLIPINIACSKENKVYHKFIKDKKCKEIFNKWCDKCRIHKESK